MKNNQTQTKQKGLTVLLIVVISLSVAWMTLFTVRGCQSPTPERTSPAVLLVKTLNAKIVDSNFHDVGFTVVSESPLKLAVEGSVNSPNELSQLKALLAEIRPENDYDFNVILLR